MNHIHERLLVTGANGQLGRAVVEELLRRGAKHLVATSRTPEKLAHLRARGVEVRAADFDRPETLRSAFAGVGRLVIISTDALEVPGRRLAQHRAAVAARPRRARAIEAARGRRGDRDEAARSRPRGR